MIPTYLRLRNFMCYRGPVEIDFRGIQVACLSGDNGAGKSALLDGITWALWGKARVSADRDLMALGTTDMEVCYAFLLDDQEVRVTRRRTRASNTSLMLDLEVRDGGDWRPHTMPSVRETQQQIDRLLRMEYETFINSAFILQGRADEFTTKTPKNRKQVLGDILNLGDYDRYEEIARQEFRGRDLRVHDIDAEMNRLDGLLIELPRLEAAVAELSQELLELVERAEAAGQAYAAAQTKVQSLEFTAQQRDMLRRQIEAQRRALAEFEGRRAQLTGQIETHRLILARRDEIEARVDELARLRERHAELSNILAERQELTERRRGLEQRMQQAIHQLETEIHSVSCQIGERELQLKEQAEVNEKLARIAAEIDTLADAPEQIRALHEAQAARETRRGELQAENKRLKQDMDEIKAKLDQLTSAGARCPVCRGELSSADRERVTAEITAEGTVLGDRYRANRRELDELRKASDEAATELERLEQQRRRLDSLQRTAATLAERKRRIEQAGSEIKTLTTHLDALRTMLATGVPGAEFRPEVEQIDRRLAEIPYDRDEHRRVQQRAGALVPVEQERRQLDVAQAELERDEAEGEMLSFRIERSREEIACAEAQEAELDAALVDLAPLRAERDRLQDELEGIERRRSEAQERFGAARQQRDNALKLQERREEIAGERKRLVEEKQVYDELMLAFGKKGIQTMIIENVLPELQDEANAILDKMPGNTMRVEFSTQRQTVKGEGTIETLDIIIGDEAGRRAYELYSGGEAFRANFAIRVALSTLLARRAGTRLQTLVIDEGFGSQDNRGRDGLIEAIHAVERDFKSILVITHIAELKDLFPTRIDIVKTADGSRVEVH